MVVCLERVADLHVAQLMPLPLAVSCFSKIQIGFYLSDWLTRKDILACYNKSLLSLILRLST